MVRNLRFFCDATYTKRKVTRLTLFLNKKKRATLFLIRDLRQRKINKRGTLFSLRDLRFFLIRYLQQKKNKRVTLFFSKKKKSEVRSLGYATYAYFDTQPTARKNENKEKAFPAARSLGNLPNLWSFLDSTLLCSPGAMGPGFTI